MELSTFTAQCNSFTNTGKCNSSIVCILLVTRTKLICSPYGNSTTPYYNSNKFLLQDGFLGIVNKRLILNFLCGKNLIDLTDQLFYCANRLCLYKQIKLKIPSSNLSALAYRPLWNFLMFMSIETENERYILTCSLVQWKCVTTHWFPWRQRWWVMVIKPICIW